MTGARFAAAGAALATAWEILGPLGQFIITLAAVFMALGWIYARVVKPGILALWRTWKAVDALEHLPQLQKDVEEIRAELEDIRERSKQRRATD